jgi:hypothetical protein
VLLLAPRGVGPILARLRRPGALRPRPQRPGLPSVAPLQPDRGDGSVGIWHETYAVEAGHHKTIYNIMPMFGLAKATENLPGKGRLETAASE